MPKPDLVKQDVNEALVGDQPVDIYGKKTLIFFWLHNISTCLVDRFLSYWQCTCWFFWKKSYFYHTVTYSFPYNAQKEHSFKKISTRNLSLWQTRLNLASHFQTQSLHGIRVLNKNKGYWWIDCMQSKHQIILDTKNTLHIENQFFFIHSRKKQKHSTLLINIILGARETSCFSRAFTTEICSLRSLEQIITG